MCFLPHSYISEVLHSLHAKGHLPTAKTNRQVLALPHYVPLYALPTLIFLNPAGAAPCPVPITCCGCPLPQFGVPHSIHSSREQIASIAPQNSVVIPL